MARNRTISPDFWTCEAVIDCRPMTRLLFIGLWNFADDFGVQPLRPRTIRMQVFPGDDVDAEGVRAMIDELAARGLVRVYEVDGVKYVAVVDWQEFQRVSKHARRRYPPFVAAVPGDGERPEVSSQAMDSHRNGTASEASAQIIEGHGNAATPQALRGDREEERPPPLPIAA